MNQNELKVIIINLYELLNFYYNNSEMPDVEEQTKEILNYVRERGLIK